MNRVEVESERRKGKEKTICLEECDGRVYRDQSPFRKKSLSFNEMETFFGAENFLADLVFGRGREEEEKKGERENFFSFKRELDSFNPLCLY